MDIQTNKSIQEFLINELSLTSWNSVDNVQQLTEGKSDAIVYRLHIVSQRRKLTGHYIVKLIDTDKPWYQSKVNEGTKGKDAYTSAGKFKDHITKVIGSKEIGKVLVVIYKQANNSVMNSISLEKLTKSKAVSLLERISYDILSEWNDRSLFNGDASVFFKEILSYRLDEEGQFEKRISKLLQNKKAKSFLFRNKVYPNPYYYINCETAWYNSLESKVFLKGKIHGDFHRKNIITTEEAGKIDYSIIDFDCFSPDAFLFYDNAYLETSIIFDNSIRYSLAEWITVSNGILNTDIQNGIEGALDEDVYLYRDAICKGVSKWLFDDKQVASKDTLIVQFYMARLAASINY